MRDDLKPDQLVGVGGRLLDPKECVDAIDVAEDDVLLYEVKRKGHE
jgi:hypothetical protein